MATVSHLDQGSLAFPVLVDGWVNKGRGHWKGTRMGCIAIGAIRLPGSVMQGAPSSLSPWRRWQSPGAQPRPQLCLCESLGHTRLLKGAFGAKSSQRAEARSLAALILHWAPFQSGDLGSLGH